MQHDSLSLDRVALPEIAISAFQHPLDLEATAQLKRIKGIDQVIAKFLDLGCERFDYIWNSSSSVKVGPKQYPQLYEMLVECCRILDTPQPELYVALGDVNAYTSGHTNPYIVLLTGLLELMSDDEIMAVIAHELGHIKCDHVLYSEMAKWLGYMISAAGQFTFGIGNVLSLPIQSALLTWYRRAELTADRAALLMVQNPEPCVSMLMKLAGGSPRFLEQLDVEEFLRQASEYGEETDQGMSQRFYRIMANVFMKGTHPFVIERAKALNEWIDSPEYEQIISGSYTRKPHTVIDGLCPNCNSIVGAGYRYCGGCGQPLVA